MVSTPQLAGQTVVVIGASSGIGLATAREARTEGADVIITARNPAHVHRAGLAIGASIAAFDATDFARLTSFFAELPSPIDHVLVTGPAPDDALIRSFDVEAAHRAVAAHLLLPLQVAARASGVVRGGGSVAFLGCAGGGNPTPRLTLMAALSTALSSLTRELAVELAPVRVNLIVSGFHDAPADVAAVAVSLMTDPAMTGATRVVDAAGTSAMRPSPREEGVG
jgi:NAD(P)-dependent dehydrogenase (short-subunit alcohol dehydrogenase family)